MALSFNSPYFSEATPSPQNAAYLIVSSSLRATIARDFTAPLQIYLSSLKIVSNATTKEEKNKDAALLDSFKDSLITAIKDIKQETLPKPQQDRAITAVNEWAAKSAKITFDEKQQQQIAPPTEYKGAANSYKEAVTQMSPAKSKKEPPNPTANKSRDKKPTSEAGWDKEVLSSVTTPLLSPKSQPANNKSKAKKSGEDFEARNIRYQR